MRPFEDETSLVSCRNFRILNIIGMIIVDGV